MLLDWLGSSRYLFFPHQPGKWEKAVRYHREELQLSESLKDHLGTAVAHRMIGESLAGLCQFKESLKHQKEYLEIAEAQGNLEEVQRAYATIGRIHYMKYKAEDRSVADGLIRVSMQTCTLFNKGSLPPPLSCWFSHLYLHITHCT